MQQIAVSTNLWREGIDLILSFLDYRWYNSKTMSEEEEVHLAVTISGTPREPWNHFAQRNLIICDIFRRPGSHMIMLMRIVSKPTLCVYVPSVAELRICADLLLESNPYCGRTAYAAVVNRTPIHSLDLVLLRGDHRYQLWLTEPNANYSYSFADLIRISVNTEGAAYFCKKSRALTSEVYEDGSDCMIEWFTV